MFRLPNFALTPRKDLKGIGTLSESDGVSNKMQRCPRYAFQCVSPSFKYSCRDATSTATQVGPSCRSRSFPQGYVIFYPGGSAKHYSGQVRPNSEASWNHQEYTITFAPRWWRQDITFRNEQRSAIEVSQWWIYQQFSLPHSYLNFVIVSGNLIMIPRWGNILLEAGEGTWGQLARYFGTSSDSEASAWNILRDVKCIFVSHAHGDHHIGLAKILAMRKKASYCILWPGDSSDDRFIAWSPTLGASLSCDNQFYSCRP